ncbi:MAG: DUF5671 domain-containing protein [bacterium]|nr:DUF5671 domain-containing protein [bacterium]
MIGTSFDKAQDRPHTSPKDVFLHLLMVGTLYASVISFITLLFQYIQYYFPDVLDYSAPSLSFTAQSSMATLIIVFPVFLFLSHLLQKEFKAHEEKSKSRLRKWLLSFTLFVAAIVIIVDLVTLIQSFLGGELTVRFLLKNATVLFVISAVFGYYLHQLKKTKPEATRNERIFVWAVSFVAVLSIVLGFILTGSPATQRLMQFDQERIWNLQTIQSQLVFHFQQKGALPETLTNISDDISGFALPRDPETGKEYEYQKSGEFSFTLCADFKTEYIISGKIPSRPIHSFETWDHGIGHACFARTIDPDFYPVREKIL